MRASLFWSPLGSGIPAGVLLARHIPLSPPITFALYAASELLLLGALVCYPLFTALRRHARRVRALHWIGTRMLRLAMLGTRAPRAAEVQAELGRRGVGVAARAHMLRGLAPRPRTTGGRFRSARRSCYSAVMRDDLADLDATAQAALVRCGDVTPIELVDAAIARIERLNPRLNAVIFEHFERARREARGPLPTGRSGACRFSSRTLPAAPRPATPTRGARAFCATRTIATRRAPTSSTSSAGRDS